MYILFVGLLLPVFESVIIKDTGLEIFVGVVSFSAFALKVVLASQ